MSFDDPFRRIERLAGLGNVADAARRVAEEQEARFIQTEAASNAMLIHEARGSAQRFVEAWESSAAFTLANALESTAGFRLTEQVAGWAAKIEDSVLGPVRQTFREQERLSQSRVASLTATASLLRNLGTVTAAWAAGSVAVPGLSRDIAGIPPVYGSLAGRLEAMASRFGTEADFDHDFAIRLAAHVSDIAAAESKEEAEELVEGVEEFFVDELEGRLGKVTSRESRRQLLLALVVLLISLLYDARSEERVLKRIDAMEQRCTERLERMESENSGLQRYVIISIVRLRRGPSPDPMELPNLYPNMRVEVLETRGQWLYVEYFDYGMAEKIRGWIERGSVVIAEDHPASE